MKWGTKTAQTFPKVGSDDVTLATVRSVSPRWYLNQEAYKMWAAEGFNNLYNIIPRFETNPQTPKITIVSSKFKIPETTLESILVFYAGNHAQKTEANRFIFLLLLTFSRFTKAYCCLYCLRVSEANEVPISSHIWVGLSTLNRP